MSCEELDASRAQCPVCGALVEVPFAQRVITVARVCERCHTSWRVTATPVNRPGWLGMPQLTRVSFVPEAECQRTAT